MTLYHYYNNCKRTTGPNKDLYNTENIVGECTHMRGNAQNLTGDVSGLHGDISGLCGDATGYFSYSNTIMFGDVTAIYSHIPIAEVL
tara:strand:+ start:270 stop:530 length:261 start_codon:yes stop_codon:yes gene_type:complete